jgi:hypothetical protein
MGLMPQTATVTTSQLQTLEHRIETLETIIKRLASGVEIKNTPPKEHISPAAERRLFKEFISFLQAEARHPSPSAASADELMKQLAGL